MLQPQTYLEIGVQHGWSLQLSNAPTTIGVDPNPMPGVYNMIKGPTGYIAQMTSDYFFANDPSIPSKIDLAFIDGMHLVENALHDFANVEKYCHESSVIVFDDVLPTTVEMASRVQCPGDWTGDVWRVYDILRERRPDLVLLLVDTQPTGVLVVLRPDPHDKALNSWLYSRGVEACRPDPDGWVYVPWQQIDLHDAVLDRRHALPAGVVLAEVARRLT